MGCHHWLLATCKMKVVSFFESLINFARLHSITLTKTAISIVTASPVANSFLVPNCHCSRGNPQ
jgi:hypothetical protein